MGAGEEREMRPSVLYTLTVRDIVLLVKELRLVKMSLYEGSGGVSKFFNGGVIYRQPCSVRPYLCAPSISF